MKKLSLAILTLALLVLAASCNTDTNTESSTPPPQGPINFTAQYIRTDGYHEGISYPIITVISSADELENYYNKYKNIYDFASRKDFTGDDTIGFSDAIEKYTEDYFAENFLVILILEEGSGSVRHNIFDVTPDGGIRFERKTPEMQTHDMAEWNILIEMKKSDKLPEYSPSFTYYTWTVCPIG